MAPETINMLPAVLLGIMVALTLFLLPHLNDETAHRRSEEPREQQGEKPEEPGRKASGDGR